MDKEVIYNLELWAHSNIVGELVFTTTNILVRPERPPYKPYEEMSYDNLHTEETPNGIYIFINDVFCWKIRRQSELNNIILLKDLYEIGCLNKSMFERFRYK